ncbi:MAG TPA: 1-(5-phosphoribosyl)-5-[(5-phosphoribosylamino)methylideneamino]imidazole-4-carboxamide isomerase [Solirubrobacterales bacterium]|nr:1-(5-phosphoribosyl)-5-[(5-phosphoribosylamino)methylideneamino]imidazole-4-carboxamide isomerase [Solirubrobacterales bacterium]
MILYPAIDILDGKAVRLQQGEYDQETFYDDDPVDAAKRWADGGAEYIHVVDLDGAREGDIENLATIERITAAVDCPIEVGGGLRGTEAVGLILEAGAARVVVGTAALRDPEFLAEIISTHGPSKVVVSVDARGGKVSLAGWTESSGVDVADAVADLSGRGVERFLFTPIEVDGMMTGPNMAELARVAAATDANVIASGGVGNLEHLRALAADAPANVEGVIVGKALYEGKFTVPEAIAALNEGSSA